MIEHMTRCKIDPQLLQPYGHDEYVNKLRAVKNTATVKAWLEGSWDVSLTDDPKKVDTTLGPNGQQRSYLVLSEAERAKGFKRPVRYSYTHKKCGTSTKMGAALSETYARNPDFYGGTFCCGCGTHFRFKTDDGDENPDGVFYWDGVPEGDPTCQLGFEVIK